MIFPQLMPFTSTSSSRVLENDGEDMQNCEHSCFFSTAHAAKDSGIALELALNLGLDLPLARVTKEQYDGMIAEGLLNNGIHRGFVIDSRFSNHHAKQSKALIAATWIRETGSR